jgi:hypothetical protein
MEGEPGTLFNAEHGLAEVRSTLSVAKQALFASRAA